MKYVEGQDVSVDFEGQEHRGEVVQHYGNGWVQAKILIDPEAQYSAPVGLVSYVMVRESHVRSLDAQSA